MPAAAATVNRVGNAWHIPRQAEPPGQTSMRSPLNDVVPESAVTVLSGNQFQGPGEAGDQTEAGSTLFFRLAGAAAWSSLPMAFRTASGNNKYYAATIPANTFPPWSVVQYYFRIAYSDHLTTFLHGSDGRSSATAAEADAQADPFSFAVRGPLQPAGEFVALDSGPLQARVYRDSGHLALAGPDLAGAAHANLIVVAPPSVRASDRTLLLGRVLSSTRQADGLQLTQALGGATATARLSFPADGVMRYEVTDWGGVAVSGTSVSAPSGAGEHFFGLGEKFNALDQAGKAVRILTFDDPATKGDHSYKVTPWFLSSRGYGFHLDSSGDSTFDLRAGAPDRYVVSNPLPALRFNVVYGPRLTDALTRYTAYTGRPPLPPPWAFGPWISSDVWPSGGEVRYAVTQFRARGSRFRRSSSTRRGKRPTTTSAST